MNDPLFLYSFTLPRYFLNLYYLLLESFFFRHLTLMVFHWNLSDSISPQILRTLLNILAILSNAEIWMVSPCPLTSKSSTPFNNLLVIVPKAPITIGIIVTFMLHSFFSIPKQDWSTYPFFFNFFQVYSVISRDSYSLWFLHSSFRWWSFMGIQLTASVFKSTGHFSIFRPILTMLQYSLINLFCSFISFHSVLFFILISFIHWLFYFYLDIYA